MTVRNNAYRVIRQAADAAQAIEADAWPRFDITAVTVEPAAGDRAVPVANTFNGATTDQAYDIVREQVSAAENTGKAITFTITPVFPRFWTDVTGIVVDEQP